MRTLIVVAASACAILLFLLTSASANSALFARHFPLLIALNGAAVIGLLALVLYQLAGLWREYRARSFGSRLKYRLLLMFSLMALLPGVLVYAVSVQFVARSIESWFDVRVDAALEGGINLGRSVLDNLLADLDAKGRAIAAELAQREPALASAMLDRAREQAGIDTAALLGANGQILAASSRELTQLVPQLPGASVLRQARLGRGYRAVEGDATSGLTLRVLVPITGLQLGPDPRLLMLTQPVPGALARAAESVQAVYRDYQELSLSRAGLKRIYTLTLTLTLLLGLLGAIALSFVLTRRLSAPLSILAEGTAAVASGDFSPRQALPARDELSVLTQSFNRMTRQLDDARAQAERSRAEVEAARAYLESVLASLSAGVLTFGADFTLRSANRGARGILEDALEPPAGLADRPRLAALDRAIRENFSTHDGDWNAQIELDSETGRPKTLLVHGSRLPSAGGAGFVAVFDDITELIAAQRSAAWGEVARRLAHEIKNPLTPIQLSAERLQLKLAGKLEPGERAMLERATSTIVNQVEALKNMVNDFRDYARLPPPKLAPLDLNALVREVLSLYESSRVAIEFSAGAQLPQVAGDDAQLRQVLHNLLRNSEDAIEKQDAPRVEITTAHESGMALLTLRDNGPGFAPDVLARAFEPYVTTKARGTGLGLAIVRKIVEEHHGDIQLSNRSPHGAEVRVRLPVSAHRMQGTGNRG